MDERPTLRKEWNTEMNNLMHESIMNPDSFIGEDGLFPGVGNLPFSVPGTFVPPVLQTSPAMSEKSRLTESPRSTHSRSRRPQKPASRVTACSESDGSGSDTGGSSSGGSASGSGSSSSGGRRGVQSRRSRNSGSDRSQRMYNRYKAQKEDEDQERFELLSRLQQMEAEKGYKSFRKLGPNDSIHDVRYEFFRAQREISKKMSVRFMQKGLVTLTGMIELGSKVYNPLNLNLDGYSKSVVLSMKDYDPIFEELYYKYVDTVSVAPELKLVFALASSVLAYHTGFQYQYQNQTQTSATEASVEEVPTRVPQPQQTMRGPGARAGSNVRPPNLGAFNIGSPVSLLSTVMGTGGSNDIPPIPSVSNIADILSGLNMVKTLMNNKQNTQVN